MRTRHEHVAAVALAFLAALCVFTAIPVTHSAPVGFPFPTGIITANNYSSLDSNGEAVTVTYPGTGVATIYPKSARIFEVKNPVEASYCEVGTIVYTVPGDMFATVVVSAAMIIEKISPTLFRVDADLPAIFNSVRNSVRVQLRAAPAVVSAGIVRAAHVNSFEVVATTLVATTLSVMADKFIVQSAAEFGGLTRPLQYAVDPYSGTTATFSCAVPNGLTYSVTAMYKIHKVGMLTTILLYDWSKDGGVNGDKKGVWPASPGCVPTCRYCFGAAVDTPRRDGGAVFQYQWNNRWNSANYGRGFGYATFGYLAREVSLYCGVIGTPCIASGGSQLLGGGFDGGYVTISIVD